MLMRSLPTWSLLHHLQILRFNDARGIRYSLFGCGLFTWAVKVQGDNQLHIAGPWRCTSEQPSVCEVGANAAMPAAAHMPLLQLHLMHCCSGMLARA
jgi:hypothetical protein